MSLSNPNKPVTEERLAEFYQSILPYLGGMPEAICNKFDKANMYSTSEKIVGCWIDGKPLYQKVLKFKTPSSINTTTYANIGASVDTAISYYATFKGTAGTWIFADSNSDANGHRISAQVNSNSHSSQPNAAMVVFGPNALSSWFNLDVYFIVYYTKTTDAANSFKWGDENDYSMDEKIIGTWIDGKPVYQKVLTVNVPASTESYDYDIRSEISNCDGIIKYDITVYVPAGGGTETYYSLNSNCTGAAASYAEFIGTNKKGRSSNLPLILNFKNTFSSQTATFYVTIQYTKTTD